MGGFMLRITKRIEARVVAAGPGRTRFIRPVRPSDATGLVAEVYAQAARDFQILPPLTMYSPIPRLLAAHWCVIRETLVAGRVPRMVKEAVASAVSRLNSCSYCLDAHTMMLRGGGHALEDPALDGVVRWASASLSPGDEALRQPPFSQQDAPEIIGTAVLFHYVNRSVEIFLPKSPVRAPRAIRGMVTRLAAATFGRRLVGLTVTPGDSLPLLPAATLPEDLGWAASNRFVAAAYSRMAAATEELADATLPPPAKSLVARRVSEWDGRAMPLSRHWVEEAVEGLDRENQAIGRLALLAALAPAQVDVGVIEAFRRHRGRDEDLVAVSAWAAFTAARRVCTWLWSAAIESVGRTR